MFGISEMFSDSFVVHFPFHVTHSFTFKYLFINSYYLYNFPVSIVIQALKIRNVIFNSNY